jgi:hypothetical protein
MRCLECRSMRGAADAAGEANWLKPLNAMAELVDSAHLFAPARTPAHPRTAPESAGYEGAPPAAPEDAAAAAPVPEPEPQPQPQPQPETETETEPALEPAPAPVPVPAPGPNVSLGPSLSGLLAPAPAPNFEPKPEPAAGEQTVPPARTAAAAELRLQEAEEQGGKEVTSPVGASVQRGSVPPEPAGGSGRFRRCVCVGGGGSFATVREAMEEACLAAQADDLPRVQRAIEAAERLSPDEQTPSVINTLGRDDRSPLYKACHAKAYSVVKWLLEQGAKDTDGNIDAYNGICAVGREDEDSEDTGERTAAVMRRFGYGPRRSPGASPRKRESEPEPEPQPEQLATPNKLQGSWGSRLRGLCRSDTEPRYTQLCLAVDHAEEGPGAHAAAAQGESHLERTADVPQEPSFGNLLKSSKDLLGRKFTKETPKLMAHLNTLDDVRKMVLSQADGVETVDGKEYPLTADMCQFEELLAAATRQSSLEAGVIEGASDIFNENIAVGASDVLGKKPAYEVTEISMEGGRPIPAATCNSKGDYYLQVGREQEMVYLYHRKEGVPREESASSHSVPYGQTSPNVRDLDDYIYEVDAGFAVLLDEDKTKTPNTKRKPNTKLYTFRDGSEKEYSNLYRTDPASALAIVYQAKLGYSQWASRPDSNVTDGGGTWTYFNEVIELTGVDSRWIARGTKSCSRKRCHEMFIRVPPACCKSFWATVCKFCWSDVEADHSTDPCQWMWIFLLQLATHLICPPLVLWSRTRKNYQMPKNLVYQRCMVLSVRWLVLVGTFCCYTRGWLPSVAKSEPIMNLVMWLFVAVTHSAYEASLDEIPYRYNDTLTASLTISTKHISTTAIVDEKSMLEKELRQFVQLGERSQKHNKFSHRMTERRLHELHDEQLQIMSAKFEAFHSEELERKVPRRSRDLVFDEVIAYLQTRLPDDWCARNENPKEVIPSAVRRTAANVRMHIKAIARQRYGTSDQRTLDQQPPDASRRSYAKAVHLYASEALRWESKGPKHGSLSPDECEAGSLDSTENHNCVCHRKGMDQSYTNSMLREWEDLETRVQSVLSADTACCGKSWCKTDVTRALGSVLLVGALVWLGQLVSRHIYIWADSECTTMKCVLFSLFAVVGLVLLMILVVTSLRKLVILVTSLRKDGLDSAKAPVKTQLVTDIKRFIAKWKVWEQFRKERETQLLKGLSRQEELAKLTALSADRLQLHSDRTGALELLSSHSFDDYDRFALELSRLYGDEDQGRLEEVLESWKDRRKLELGTSQNRGAELDRTASVQSRQYWIDEFRRVKVEREAAIIKLRAQLIFKLDQEANPVQTDVEAPGERTPERRQLQSTISTARHPNDSAMAGLYPLENLQPFVVAEGILALAHTYSKKVYRFHLVLVVVFCALFVLAHPLKDSLARLLEVSCTDDVSFACTDPVNATVLNLVLYRQHAGSCAHIVYNATFDAPCGEFCEVDSTVFFACAPKRYEVIARIISSVIGASLMFCIFADMADIVRGYQIRQEAMQLFSQLTPHQGMHTYERKSHCKCSCHAGVLCCVSSPVACQFCGDAIDACVLRSVCSFSPWSGLTRGWLWLSDGLLPTFEFQTATNIIAWNRIRLFLQTYDSHNFAKQQHQVTWILMIPLIFILGKISVMLLGTSFNEALSEDAHAAGLKFLLHHDSQPVMVDTLILKVILVLVLLFVQVYHMCVSTFEFLYGGHLC